MQAGGHPAVFEGERFTKHCKTENEPLFYEGYGVLPEGLRQFIPRPVRVDRVRGDITMCNVLYGYESYVIVDFKLGKYPFGRNLCEERFQKRVQKARATTSFEFGFRFTGMAVHTDSARLQIDKSEGRYTTYEETRALVSDVLRGVVDDRGRINSAICAVTEQLVRLRDALKASAVVPQGSSVLLLFDLKEPGNSVVRMVDFTYAYTSDGRQYQLADQQYTLDGIDNLVRFLDGMRCE